MDFNPFTLLSRFRKKEITLINEAPVSGFTAGTDGTEIYGGYITEEPLKKLHGKQGIEQFDLMRRGDGNVAMILRAVKLPIRSATWTIQPDDDSPEAAAQVKLLKHILFDDLGKPWTRFTGEALTFVDFGYSLFEKTYKPVLCHPEFGSYIGLKELGFRSQKTIERWIVDENGNLEAVEQQAYGDTGRIVQMDAPHLIRFCPDQEGDNFEGQSYLRPCYGPWFRKNLYLKLLAAGIEKYAVPIPILTVPSGKENSEEYRNALAVLRAYTSNQSNYITKPAGWDLEIKITQLDPAKIRESVKDENQEMVNSVLASFLLLGQTGAGSYALGSTLGDFFGTAVQFLGDHICEVMNAKDGLLADLVKLNFGTSLKCKLKVEGIKDSASTAFAEVIDKLIKANVVKPDAELEKFAREKFKLPVAKPDETPRVLPAPVVPGSPQPVMFSENQIASIVNDIKGAIIEDVTKLLKIEKPLPSVIQLAEGKPRQDVLIRKGASELRGVIEGQMIYLGVAYIERMRKAYQAANGNGSKQLKVPHECEIPSSSDYTEILISLSMIQASKAVEPIKANLKLASSTDEKLAKVKAMIDELNEAIEVFEVSKNGQDALRIGYLQRSIKARLASIRSELSLSQENIVAIKSRVQTMTATQVADLKKRVDLQYNSSVSSTDSERTLFHDLEQSRIGFINSPVVNTGPDILASQNVNESILRETDGEPEVESYTFVAVDDEDTSDICRELNGRTFGKDDPNLFRYHPPLHHNCRSYMAVNLKSFKGNPEITEGPLDLSKGAQNSITLSEETYRQIFGCDKKSLTQRRS